MANEEDLYRLTGGDSHFIEKYRNFKRDRLVAKDRENLMFCVKADCQNVLDIRKALGRKLTCQICLQKACKLCRQEYHGETSKCLIEADVEEWQNNLTGVKTGNCPKCHAMIEKEDGCSHMTCPVCGNAFCWVCGMDPGSWFHTLQLGSGYAGVVCDLLNNLNNMLE